MFALYFFYNRKGWNNRLAVGGVVYRQPLSLPKLFCQKYAELFGMIHAD